MSNIIYQVCYLEHDTYSYTGESEVTALITLNAQQALNRAKSYDKGYIYLWASKNGKNYRGGTKQYTPKQFKEYIKTFNGG